MQLQLYAGLRIEKIVEMILQDIWKTTMVLPDILKIISVLVFLQESIADVFTKWVMRWRSSEDFLLK